MFTIHHDITQNTAGPGLDRLQAALGDLTPLLDDIGLGLVAEGQLHFEEERDVDGQPWQPSQRAQQDGGQTLLDSGKLRDSITYAVAGNSVQVGTNAIQAALHNFGGTIKPKTAKALAFTLPGGAMVSVQSVTLPKRSFVGWGDNEQASVLDTVATWLQEVAQ